MTNIAIYIINHLSLIINNSEAISWHVQHTPDRTTPGRLQNKDMAKKKKKKTDEKKGLQLKGELYISKTVLLVPG